MVPLIALAIAISSVSGAGALRHQARARSKPRKAVPAEVVKFPAPQAIERLGPPGGARPTRQPLPRVEPKPGELPIFTEGYPLY